MIMTLMYQKYILLFIHIMGNYKAEYYETSAHRELKNESSMAPENQHQNRR